MRKSAVFTVVMLSAAATSAWAQVKVDPALPDYKPTRGISGRLKSIGSDTMNNIMAHWAEGFKRVYPNVQIEIEGKGSATAPPALIAGTADFGPMSRAMEPSEIAAFKGKFDYPPAQLVTGIDMLAVFVNKDNPIAKQGLTLQQVDAIFSNTRRLGGKQDIRTWGQLGLGGQWKDKPISLYGRNAASGTYGYFKDHVLKKGDFKSSVKEQPGSAGVVQGVGSDLYAIGYSGMGYRTADVHAVPLGSGKGKMVAAEPENALKGTYPLARYLYVYVNYKPGGELRPVKQEFLKYVLSKQGQEVVVMDGFLPLPAKVAAKTRSKIGLEGETALQAAAQR